MKIALTLNKREITSAINNKYLEYVHNAGMQPLSFDQRTQPDLVSSICDGLILKGGSDLDPIYYGYDNYASISIDPELDGFERQLLWEFVNAGKPVLGICRGFQLMFRELAVERTQESKIFGFKYLQHMEGHNQAAKEVDRPYAYHYVHYQPQLYDLDSDEVWRERRYLPVNSMHHQGIQKDTGKGSKQFNVNQSPITPLAWSGQVLEAFSAVEGRMLAVQWHPEELNDIALLQNIFRARDNIADALVGDIL
jgi:gamma-glutamyl-gamma-aminobutyrate hydrolase PuuD